MNNMTCYSQVQYYFFWFISSDCSFKYYNINIGNVKGFENCFKSNNSYVNVAQKS